MPTSITSAGITFDDATTLTTGVLPTANIANGAITPAKLSQPYTLATSVASTSGTAIDFTGIPSWARRITVMCSGLSTNGTSVPIVQLGDSGGIETSGYAGATGYAGAGNNANGTAYNTGFLLNQAVSASVVSHCVATLANITGNQWMFGLTGAESSAANMLCGSGSKTLSATLDRVRITTVNGADTFDAGSINISYEG